MPDPLVSVVIPTFGRPRRLRECLNALASQGMPKDAYEVIVVDDGSSEPLEGIVADLAALMHVRLIRQGNAGPAAARNHGARDARAPLVAFTDDDCVPQPTWLERLVAEEREHPGALVGGSIVNGLPGDLFATTSQFVVDLVYEHFDEDPGDAYFLASNNILCRRDRFFEIGGFDQAYRLAGAEDRDFCDRWRAAGGKLVWRTDAVVEHRHAQSLQAFIDLHDRYGRGAYLYQAKRRARGSGTMREDLGFHRSLPVRIWRRLGRPPGYWRSAQIGMALVLWQLANAVGFFAQAWAARRSS